MANVRFVQQYKEHEKLNLYMCHKPKAPWHKNGLWRTRTDKMVIENRNHNNTRFDSFWSNIIYAWMGDQEFLRVYRSTQIPNQIFISIIWMHVFDHVSCFLHVLPSPQHYKSHNASPNHQVFRLLRSMFNFHLDHIYPLKLDLCIELCSRVSSIKKSQVCPRPDYWYLVNLIWFLDLKVEPYWNFVFWVNTYIQAEVI